MKPDGKKSRRPKRPAQFCILVLGMHRSGTSALTRVLNLHGVDLGQNLLGPAIDNNIHGFWERADVVELHERLLADLGRSWHDPRPLPVGWLQSVGAAIASAEIARILGEFSGSPVFAIKDPRLCQFLELWLPVLERLEISPRVVFSIRHPAEVADSLHRRDGWPQELSWLLWSRSMIETPDLTKSLPRCVVSYKRLLGDWRGAMEQITRQLRLELPISSDQAAAGVTEFLDVGEQHSVQSRAEQGKKTPRYLKDIYSAFLGIEAGKPWSLLDELAKSRTQFNRSTVPLHEDLGRRSAGLGVALGGNYRDASAVLTDPSDGIIDELVGQVHALIVDRDAHVSSLAQISKLYEEQMHSLILDRDAQANGREQISLMYEELRGRHEQDLEVLFLQIAEKDDQRKSVETLLLAAREAIGRANEDYSAQAALLREALSALASNLDDLNAENRLLAEELASSETNHRDLIIESEVHVEEILKLRGQVEAAGAQEEHLKSVLIDLEGRSTQAIADLSIQVDELWSRKRKLADQLSTTESNYRQAVAESGERAEQVLGLRSQVTEISSESAELRSTLEELYRSSSWRLTAPLRKVTRLISRVAAPIRRFLVAGRVISPPLGDASVGPDGIPAANAGRLEQRRFSSSILLVSYYCPTRAHAGGLRILDIYSFLKEANPTLQIDLYTHHRPGIDWSIDECRQIFDNVYLAPGEALTVDGLKALGCDETRYDVVDLQFHQAGRSIVDFRRLGAKVIFTPMESALRVFLIGLRSFFSDLSRVAMHGHKDALRDALEEIAFCRMADEAVCVSKTDAALLRIASWPTRVSALETGLSKLEFGDALERKPQRPAMQPERLRVLYVAYFGSQTNVAALKWYLDNVHPIVKQRVPGYLLTVVGRGNLSPFAGYADECLEIVGEVPQMGPYIEQAAIGIAPALGGSGFRGKVNQYALFGVPCVVSPISLKGLAYKNGQDILVAGTAKDFADACVKLLVDPVFRKRVGDAAHERCMRQYTWASKDAQLSEIYRVRRNMLNGQPKVSVLVPSYNHAGYLKQRIESILGQTYRNMELVVIDDCSPDHSDQVIQELRKTTPFTYIRNVDNSGTPFAAWERIAKLADGDFIWVCESDDFAEPGFLETAVRALIADQAAVLYYCNSWVVDEAGARIGDTSEYFTDTWRDPRWDHAFSNDGRSELINYQQRGQVVPNMSSALIDSEAFRHSYRPVLKRFKLTGDWLFIGWLMQRGRVIFDPARLSNFRMHEITSRVRVQSARSQAEFILTKYLLFRSSRRPMRELSSVLATDAIRFAYEPARWHEVVAAMLRVSPTRTLMCAGVLSVSVATRPGLLRKIRGRLAHARGLNQ